MKIHQIIRENVSESTILKDLKWLSQAEQTVFLELILTNSKNIPNGDTKKSTDGRTFRWNGTDWININTGRAADEKMRLNLSTEGKVTASVRNLYQIAKDNDLIEPLRKKIIQDKAKKKSKSKKTSRRFDTGLVKAMQRATGRAGPAKEPGDKPDSWFN